MVKERVRLGHARRVDVLKGGSTREDKFGNDGADALAVAGAASHAVPADVVEGAQCRTHLALNVHSMMLAIVCARQTECPISCGGEADRGSDLGEDTIDVLSDCDTEPEACCTECLVESGTEILYSCTDPLDDELTGNCSL